MPCDKKELLEFVSRWQGRGYEKGDTQQFWLQLLRTIGYSKVDDVLFEFHVSSGGFIDVWIPDAGVLIEQKALGIDLDKEELRQGKQKTPLTQALDYVDELPRLEQPRFVITCNFSTFRVYDRDAYGRSQLPNNAFEFTLDELASHPEYLAFINDPTNSRLEKEKTVSIKAGELIGKLYDKLREGYMNPDSEESMHALNVLCVRLVFCLYCEDAGLFGKDAFYNYLKDVPANRIRAALKNLFRALDTNLPERDPYDLEVKAFPYVNGGLFRDESEVPNFTDETKSFLLYEVSSHIDWSQISPTIFGGIFESTLNPETRRSGGMHYTSPENIHKVIDPLFLDDLKEELKSICSEEGTTPRKRENALKHFHEKICSLTFFDPACGSGNFLTETYTCLRKLEDTVLNELRKGQTGFSLGDEEETGKRVSLNQFYGIEINDFAVTVAETALWISRLKANGETSMFYDAGGDDFPLSEKAHIVEGNALRIDWNSVLPASECNYIMGNPPFVGQDGKTDVQRDDMKLIWGEKVDGYLDYVTAWYRKSADYFITEEDGKFAFVSTNSICQGQPVAALFRPLFNEGWRISFARTSFVWQSEASNIAHVHVVIVGMDKNFGLAKLYDNEGTHEVVNINPYLADAPTFFIDKLNRPLSEELRPAVYGSKPADGGFLQIKTDEEHCRAIGDPIAALYVRRCLGAAELINSKRRWCLWLEDATQDEIRASSYLSEKVDLCKQWRSAQKESGDAFKLKEIPHLFRPNEKRPKGAYLCIPNTFSGKRQYFTAEYIEDGAIATNSCFMIEDTDCFAFSVLSSSIFMLWQNTVGGRLKSDCRFANTLVWNTFPIPKMTEEQRLAVINAGKEILLARKFYEPLTLADLYDPQKFEQFSLLSTAHSKLDKVINASFGFEDTASEGEVSARLVELYSQKISAMTKS